MRQVVSTNDFKKGQGKTYQCIILCISFGLVICLIFLLYYMYIVMLDFLFSIEA
jgi:hypothetical protein